MPKGPKGEKRHADTVQNAMLIGRIATGDAAAPKFNPALFRWTHRRNFKLRHDQNKAWFFEHIRAEIERVRHQISRQRGDIQSLQPVGIGTLPAEALLARMQATIDNLCTERDKHVGEKRMKYPGTSKVVRGPQLRLR